MHKLKVYIGLDISFLVMAIKNKPRKKRRSKGIVIDKETGEFAGIRRIVEIGGAYYVGVPREFVETHNLKGKSVHIMGNGTMKIIPYKDDRKQIAADNR